MRVRYATSTLKSSLTWFAAVSGSGAPDNPASQAGVDSHARQIRGRFAQTRIPSSDMRTPVLTSGLTVCLGRNTLRFMTRVQPPIDLTNWIEENADKFKPPVSNRYLYDGRDFFVMVIK